MFLKLNFLYYYNNFLNNKNDKSNLNIIKSVWFLCSSKKVITKEEISIKLI